MARRKPTPRHGRTVARFTPRRWLPFVALTGIVAAGVVVASRDSSAPPPASEASAEIVLLTPTVAEPGALSSAWFCGGGSAQGEQGPAELSVVIANDDGRGAVADITVVDDHDGHAVRQVEVPANGRARVALADIRGGDWVAATVEVRGGRAVVDREVRGPDGFDAGPCATSAAREWYVPSGSTVREAEEYLSIFNPFPDSSSVDISFATESGRRAPRALQALSIPGRSVRVVRVKDTITARTQIAATVRARSGRVVVDRVQTYSGKGDPVAGKGEGAVTTAAPIGLVSTPGFPGAADRWFFPGSSLSDGNRTQLAVYNPSDRSAEVDVTLGYQEPGLHPANEPIQLTIPAKSSEVVDLTDDPDILPGIPFTIDAQSIDDRPIVAERLSFTGRPAKRRGATVTAGSPVAATRWLVAQGGPSKSRSSSVVVANPGPRAVHLTVVELTGGTRRQLEGGRITIPKGDRRAIPLDGAATAATLEIRADGAVVVAYGLSQSSGLGLASAGAEPFPETISALPPTS